MEKCLVTKLNGIVNDNSLLKPGELRVSFKSTGSSKMLIVNQQLEKQTLSIIGNGYFTDTSNSNLGKTKDIQNSNTTFYVSDGDFELSIPNKYKLRGLHSRNCSIKDLAELKYSTLIGYIELINCEVSGDIASLANLTQCGYISLANTQVSGDIASLANLTQCEYISLSNTQVSGDIASLANLTQCEYIILANTQVSGDIASLANLTQCEYISLANTQVSGDIASFANLKKLKTLYVRKGCNGDIATLSPVLQFINTGSSNNTWSTRPSSSTIISMESINLGNYVDKMLQDQAQCVKPEIVNEQVWQRTINIKGTRTAASDNAVEALQAKGYTIIVNLV